MHEWLHNCSLPDTVYKISYSNFVWNITIIINNYIELTTACEGNKINMVEDWDIHNDDYELKH